MSGRPTASTEQTSLGGDAKAHAPLKAFEVETSESVDASLTRLATVIRRRAYRHTAPEWTCENGELASSFRPSGA